MNIELGPVDRITADAMGEPGQRTFFIQGRKGDRVVTLLVEKQQVQLLAASVLEILARIGKETGEGQPEEAMGLEEPLIPEWRVGRLSVGYQEEQDLLLLEAEELVPGDDDEEDEDAETDDEEEDRGAGPEDALEDIGESAEVDAATIAELETLEAAATAPGRVRFWATREQMLALARHGAAVCGKGRPTCRYCDQPIDPEGHVCPAMNGHRGTGTE